MSFGPPRLASNLSNIFENNPPPPEVAELGYPWFLSHSKTALIQSLLLSEEEWVHVIPNHNLMYALIGFGYGFIDFSLFDELCNVCNGRHCITTL